LEQQYRLEKLRFDGMNKDNTDRINGLKDDIKNIMVKIEGSKEKLKLFEDRVKELDGYLTGKKDVENLIYSHTKNESVIENNISTIKKELKFLTSNDTCPTCKQSIDDKFKNNKIKTLNLKIKELTDKLETEKSNILKYKKLMDGFREIEGKIQKNKVSMASIKTSILEGENYIKKINSQIKSLQKVVDDDVKDEKVLNEIMVEIESEQKNYKKLLSERQYFDTISMLLKDSGIKTQIIKQYLPLINKIVNKHLVALDFFVNFNLDDNFKETIKSRHRDDFVYNNFSEGEKSRINLSLLFAWREIAKLKNSNHTNLLILDEIFDSSLDNIGIDYLLNILQSTEGGNNFIISHKGDVLFDKFDRVVEFEKKKNFSKMKVLQ
jgi:predicted  nucleic acid-binding Zn-ribbon protein